MAATTHDISVGRYSAGQVNSGLSIPEHDYIALSDYNANDDPGTIEYYVGGATGQLVCTLTLEYDESGNLTSITKE